MGTQAYLLTLRLVNPFNRGYSTVGGTGCAGYLYLATYNYFSHTGRDGSMPWDRMTRDGYVWRAAGENIAAGYTTTRAVVDGWLKSPGHCANIMSANFKNVGVGYGYRATSTYKAYWVTDFGTLR